jgi:4-hydroxy-tetrahydrodipicolinate synthase
VNLLPATVERLAGVKNIAAVKEASGNLGQVCEILRRVPKDFVVMSGDDALTLPMMALGAKGVISVASNAAPALVSQMCAAFLAGDTAKARELHFRLWELFEVCFVETNPIPVKNAVAMMGLCSDEVRLPLCDMAEGNRKKVAAVLAAMKLVKKGRKA